MERLFRLVAAILILILSNKIACADFWARPDRPWSYWELKQSIHYCRIKPRTTGDIALFVDLVSGREIDKCMSALGWVGVAR